MRSVCGLQSKLKASQQRFTHQIFMLTKPCCWITVLLVHCLTMTHSQASNVDEWQEVRSQGADDSGRALPEDAASPWQSVERSQETLVSVAALSAAAGLRKRINAIQMRTDNPVVAVPEIREFTSSPTPGNSTIAGGQAAALARDYSNVVSVENLDMFAGELKVLGKVDVSRVAIGNGGIIRAELLKTGELLVIAQSEGSSSVRLWHKDDTQSAYNIRVSTNDPQTRIRMERMVRLRVRMVEFRKSALGQLGIDWSDGTAGPTFAAAGDAIGNNLFRPAAEGFDNLPNQVAPFSTYFGIASNITSRINFLSQNGDAVTLAEPVLSAVNGGQASFLAGGEVPYPSVGSNGQTTVDFKEYGVRLQVAPRIDDAGNVRTLVETEISQLDSAVSVNGAPGLLTRRAQTEVNVRSGETIVISGLLSSESSKDMDMIPGIGRLPIIGRLFSSKNSRNTVTELVIFVTPEVIEPEQPMMTARQRDIQQSTTANIASARQSLPLME